VIAAERIWYRPGGWGLALAPLGGLFAAVAGRRRQWLQRRYQGRRFAAPVVVVGNLAVGGTGKTPLLIALAEQLRARGRRPGVVSRGHGGRPGPEPVLVTPAHPAAVVGDEPRLIALTTGCPVVVCPDRRAAVDWLLANCACDLVLSDDGLQHYRLHRDFEIVVIDGARGLGNGRCLPAGPLREPPARLAAVDAVVVNGGDYRPPVPALRMRLQPTALRHLASGRRLPATAPPAEWGPQPRVHAVAGIGHPARFRATLERLGMRVELRALPDHHPLCAADLRFDDALPVVITAKDAVKCEGFADPRLWVLEVAAELAPEDWAQLLSKIDQLN
jgi:tetraacyldisaccharide 4'-kinase